MFKLKNLPISVLLMLLVSAMVFVVSPSFSSGAFAVELIAAEQASASLHCAETLYAEGDEQGALSELRQLILEHSDSPDMAAAHVLMARILIDQQRYADAVMYLQRLETHEKTNASQLLLAIALQHQSDENATVLTQADHIIATLRGEFFSGVDQQNFYLAQARSLCHQHQSLQALVVLHESLTLDLVVDQTAVFDQINTVLTALSPEEVAEAEFMFSATELNDAIVLFRAQQAWYGGDKSMAQSLAEQLIQTAQTSAARISAAELLDKVYGQRWQRRAIGVVLPLSGRYAPFGTLVRQGIELAAEQTGSAVQFIFLDSQADPQQGLQAVRSLIEGYRVLGIIGPLTGAVAQRVTEYVNRAQVPLLTLSHREGLPEQGAFIFRNCLTAEQQVQALAEYAIEILGLNTYAILYPDNDSGVDFAARFRAAIEFRGGDIEYSLPFAEQGTDFRRQLLLLKGEDPDAPPEDDSAADQESKEALALQEVDAGGEGVELLTPQPEVPDWLPTVDFEALFVPAYADTVALLAPQLAFYGIENVQLLGINGWNSHKLLQQAGRYTKGAIFSDGFYVGSADEYTAAFVASYQKRFGDKPSILEAQAYDCATMMLQVMLQPGTDSPLALAQGLSTLRDFPGVAGVRGFDANGEAQREVCLIQLERRNFRQLHYALPQQEEELFPEERTRLDWR